MGILVHRQDRSFLSSRRVKLFLAVFSVTAVVVAMALLLAPQTRGLLHSSAGSGGVEKSSDGLQVVAVFKDVPSDDENAAAIAALKQQGLIRGFEDGSFKPLDTIRREEFIKLVVAAKKADPHPVSNNHCFKDVGAEWFARYVCYAKRMGWVQGYEGGRFGAGANITGVEALTIITRVFGVEINSMVLLPDRDLLRGQAAGLIVRALNSSRSAR